MKDLKIMGLSLIEFKELVEIFEKKGQDLTKANLQRLFSQP